MKLKGMTTLQSGIALVLLALTFTANVLAFMVPRGSVNHWNSVTTGLFGVMIGYAIGIWVGRGQHKG